MAQFPNGKWLNIRAELPAPLVEAPAVASPQAADTKASVRTSPVGVGDIAPDFSLADHRGGTARLSAPGDAKATVLVFYRGYW